MHNFKYIWKNYGMTCAGHDLERIIIEIDESEANLSITFWTAVYNRCGLYVVDKTREADIDALLAKLSEVPLPETNIPGDGCDGSAWEIEADGQHLEGYCDRPDWLVQIERIIGFRKIYAYVKQKLGQYQCNFY